MKLKVKFTSDEAKEFYKDKDILVRASEEAAGLDVTAFFNGHETINYNGNQKYDSKFSMPLAPGDFMKVPTGMAFEPVSDDELELKPNEVWYVKIVPRSGLAASKGLSIVNAPGVVDCDYRGEVFILLINNGKSEIQINNGDRIAQAIVSKATIPQISIVDNITKTERDDGGFGSSGITGKLNIPKSKSNPVIKTEPKLVDTIKRDDEEVKGEGSE